MAGELKMGYFPFIHQSICRMKRSSPSDPDKDGSQLPVKDSQRLEPIEAAAFEEIPPWFFDDVLFLTEMLAKPIEDARREAKDFNPAFFTIYI